MAKAKQPKQTNLSLAKVKKVSKSLKQTEIHVIEDGHYAGEQITFYPTFNIKTIEELLTEFNELINEATKLKVGVSKENQFNLILLLTIKHFTHFKESINFSLLGDKGKSGMIDTLDHFYETGLLHECINKMFLPSEMAKVFDKLTDFAAMGLLSVELDKKMLDKLDTLKIRNEDVFKQLSELNIENKIVQ